MLPLGVFILVLVLLYYSLVLIAPYATGIISSLKEKKPVSSLLANIEKYLLLLQEDNIRTQSGRAALIFALWNFFAPDFGDAHGGVTLIGAIIPAFVLFIDSLVLTPSLITFLPFEPAQNFFQSLTKQIGSSAGWITLLVAILHMMLYRFPLF